jgi:hypothetical protein
VEFYQLILIASVHKLLIVLLLTLSASIFGRPIDLVRLNNSAKCTSNFRISKPINPFGKIGIQKVYSAYNFVIELPFFEKIINLLPPEI